jgi:putative membrane protein
MHQLNGKQRSDTLLKRSIGFVQVVGVGVLLVLTSCAPGTDNASAPDQTTNDNAQAQSTPVVPVSPGSTTGTSGSPSDMILDPESINILDNALVIKGAQDNLFEIQAGELAIQQATNTEVKQFAQKMVRDHTQATDLIQQAAAERNITLPTDMGAQNQAVLARLSDLSGAEFDRAYMTEMVNSHQKDVALARNQLQNGKDQELKALITEKLPALEGHLQMAQTLAQQLSS